MRRLKVVQIGLAHDHALILAEIMRRSDLFEVVGFAVPDSDKEYLMGLGNYERAIEKFCKSIPQYSVEELLELPDIDAVFIETEELTSVKYAKMAAAKNLHIHMDKPGCANHEEFKELIQLVKKNGTVFHMGYMYRYNPAIERTLERIKNGELGQIYSVEAHMDCHHPPKKRQWLEQFPGGMLFFLGCHLIDMIYRIKGEPEEVIPLSTSTGLDGVTAKDYGMVAFKYKDGVSFAKSCAIEAGGFMRRQLVICGSKGTVRIEPWEAYAEGGQYTVWREIENKGYPDWADNGTCHQTEPYNRYDRMLEAFNKMVCGEIENPCGYDYEEKLHELIMKAVDN